MDTNTDKYEPSPSLTSCFVWHLAHKNNPLSGFRRNLQSIVNVTIDQRRKLGSSRPNFQETNIKCIRKTSGAKTAGSSTAIATHWTLAMPCAATSWGWAICILGGWQRHSLAKTRRWGQLVQRLRKKVCYGKERCGKKGQSLKMVEHRNRG